MWDFEEISDYSFRWVLNRNLVLHLIKGEGSQEITFQKHSIWEIELNKEYSDIIDVTSPSEDVIIDFSKIGFWEGEARFISDDFSSYIELQKITFYQSGKLIMIFSNDEFTFRISFASNKSFFKIEFFSVDSFYYTSDNLRVRDYLREIDATNKINYQLKKSLMLHNNKIIKTRKPTMKLKIGTIFQANLIQFDNYERNGENN